MPQRDPCALCCLCTRRSWVLHDPCVLSDAGSQGALAHGSASCVCTISSVFSCVAAQVALPGVYGQITSSSHSGPLACACAASALSFFENRDTIPVSLPRSQGAKSQYLAGSGASGRDAALGSVMRAPRIISWMTHPQLVLGRRRRTRRETRRLVRGRRNCATPWDRSLSSSTRSKDLNTSTRRKRGRSARLCGSSLARFVPKASVS